MENAEAEKPEAVTVCRRCRDRGRISVLAWIQGWRLDKRGKPVVPYGFFWCSWCQAERHEDSFVKVVIYAEAV